MIRLRKIEPSDLPFLYQWENDATMWADSDTHNPLSRHDLRQYIESSTGDIYRDGQLRLIIESSDANPIANSPMTISHGVMGCIDLFDFDARNRKAAIGMYIAPYARGKGVGKKSVELLMEYAFGHLQLRMLYAIIAVENTSCSRIYEQLGFAPSSILTAWTLEDDAILWQKVNDK
jgi:diamine N-acetyltransferase